MNASQHQILFATPSDAELWVKIVGQGNCQLSPTFKSLFSSLSEKGFSQVILDLQDCQGVDSTFIGVLAKLATQIKASPDSGRFLLREANERVAKSISSLGIDALDQFVTAQATPSPDHDLFNAFCQNENSTDDQKKEVCKTSLEAHTTLCDLNEDNKKKFQHVLDFLKDDFDSNEGGK